VSVLIKVVGATQQLITGHRQRRVGCSRHLFIDRLRARHSTIGIIPEILFMREAQSSRPALISNLELLKCFSLSETLLEEHACVCLISGPADTERPHSANGARCLMAKALRMANRTSCPYTLRLHRLSEGPIDSLEATFWGKEIQATIEARRQVTHGVRMPG